MSCAQSFSHLPSRKSVQTDAPRPVTNPASAPRIFLPSVDEVLRDEICVVAAARFGRTATVAAVRETLGVLRTRALGGTGVALAEDAIAAQVMTRLEASQTRNLRRVFNLTGTVLHTNLGRALLAEEAVAAAVEAMRHPAALEFDLETGGRGERDDAVRGIICELTGAEDAIAVNNNAAAVILVLNTLAAGREAIVSRGELIEIGGAFRMPDIMARAGTCLVEIGTTNRTHLRDYEGAIGPATGCLMKVHTSNYLIQGFTSQIEPHELAALAKSKAVPLVDDLGSGTLIDLTRFGLRHERTVQDAVKDGADLVTFSGDKLLGGPQAGFILGRKDLVRACAKNPMKRAMRLDKIRLAALEATLRLYRDPDSLVKRLPTLAMLAAAPADLHEKAGRLLASLQAALGGAFAACVCECTSQIGSGALPLESIPSGGLSIAATEKKNPGMGLRALAQALRALPIPVIGRIAHDALILDMRTLDDETGFRDQLPRLKMAAADGAV